MKTTNLKSLTKKVEACKKAIAKERDKLREYIDELNDIERDADEAVDNIVTAVDAMERAADEISQRL